MDELEPVLDMMKADTVFYQYGYTKGDWEAAFKNADRIFEEDLQTGYQEHVYLEVQGMIGFYENGKSTRSWIAAVSILRSQCLCKK